MSYKYCSPAVYHVVHYLEARAMSSQNPAAPELLMLATAVSVVAVATLLWRALFWSSTNKLPYPPGPRPRNWLSGNLADIPATKPWVTYTQWANTYGAGNEFMFRIQLYLSAQVTSFTSEFSASTPLF